ncbi:alpha/beta hydrolase [Actibacterium sp. 188UL27-1]|uniref:alpha/beta hydrolase n=1 Tax=Actibacterium sp. 188UL27-1 TaxID=2786961 RepID=UPI00195D74DB|nr:alpha/beta fold hydrolase [Actibacterium sp. 188UL27-1]MBM7067333.1 alpha/beta fold hydrolase [Actibacterium sp. 188UL27-1]
MTRELTVARREPKSGNVASAVVFLHGYGANGADLMGLADPLAEHMPDTLFLAVDAPETCVNNPMGYQWFPIPHMDGSDPQAAGASFAQSVDDLNAFLDHMLLQERLEHKQVILLGFSQGTMMSLHVAARRSAPFAGVVGFSGRLLQPERLAAEVTSKPPVMLLHGDRDPVVPYESMQEAAEPLADNDFDVYTHTMAGAPHTISPDGLQQAYAFMADALRKAAI